MIHKLSTNDMSREDWLKARKNGLGGSDMAAVLGMNEYKGPYAVWAEKRSDVIEETDNEAMRVGRDLESYVAERFCEASGKKVRRVNAIITNDDYPHIQINIDREVVGEDAILECKTANAYGQKKFSDGIPDYYYVQCVTYMGVYEKSRCYLAVLIMGIGFKCFLLTTHEDDVCPEWCEKMVYVDGGEFDAVKYRAAEFWKYVESGEEPPVDATPGTSQAISEMYPASVEDKTIDAFPIKFNLKARMALKAQIDDLTKELNEQDNYIKNYLKDAERAVCDGFSVSYKTSTRKTLDSKKLKADYKDIDWDAYSKTSEYRTLRVTEKN